MPERRAAAGAAQSEIAKFDAAAAQWWDPDGPMAPLHAMQPARLDFLRLQILASGLQPPDAPRRRPLTGLRALDLGCGAGLASEPLARLGAQVVGADLSEGALAAARAHAARGGLDIDYRGADAGEIARAVAEEAEAPFDVVVSLEVIEHVADRGGFLAAAAACLRPGGLIVLSTLNRTVASFLGAIVAAEFVARQLPIGTHDWRRFLPPETLAAELVEAGLDVVDRIGFVYRPLARDWRLDERDLSINYAMAAVKPA